MSDETIMPEALDVVNPPNQEIVTTTMSAEILAAALDEESKKRQLIEAYIQKNLKEGVDFGRFMMKSGRESKNSLFKPGAEKICSLLHLKPVFKIDQDLAIIVGQGIIPYICELVNRHTGEIEGEGRGSCSISEKDSNANTAIKIAQKRAQIDAVLRVSALSGQFSQDLEDLPNVAQIQNGEPPMQPPQRASEYDGSTCNFGKDKGVKWADMDGNKLNWYAGIISKSVEDPAKAKFKAHNLALLTIIQNILEEREGM